ncbi:MAG TPA: DUF1269 domain-containing protein [Gammaproteobacteria bacterium]|nr:DUF1269 domain-containing protein [Gammaproteobacteria bacterium]
MHRRFLLVSDVDEARELFNDLLRAGLQWRQVRVMARDDVLLEDLPEVPLSQRTDLLPALRRGLLIGGGMGLGGGLIAIMVPPIGDVLGFPAVLVMGALGAVFGALSATMIAIDVPHPDVRRFREAIDAGRILMMVDVPAGRAGELDALIRQAHPKVTDGTAADGRTASP